ncbi:MAG: hypothetical protein LBL46_01625 [Rickettsiales bacterium]|nr:hypothetical protein [Rickettsiales bacterium]
MPDIRPINLNDYADEESRLYDEVYIGMLKNGRMRFLGVPVRLRHAPQDKLGRDYTFRHLISEDSKYGIAYCEDDRTPDIRRCERLHWIPFIIANAVDKSFVRCWENTRKKNGVERRNVVLWIKNENYLIVLEKRDRYFLLKTAYLHNSDEWKIAKIERDMNSSSDPRA